MSFNVESLLRRLDEFSAIAGKPARFVVAFSGGLDSTVLTHALASNRGAHATTVIAVHIDHGLHAASADWTRSCATFAASLEIEFMSRDVTVDLQSGLGPEASARAARYAALRTLIVPGDWLLSAHHENDQAETLLLNLLRGSGPMGLAGIAAVRRFESGWLARPLLDVSREDLLAYAQMHDLKWIDDPSNQDQDLDRNFLRHDVMPRLEARWPDASGRLRRSAQLAGEAAMLLSELAEIDRVALGDQSNRLLLDQLRALPAERQRNVLRHVVRGLGLPMPGANHLQSIVADLIPARDDAQPLVSWPGAEVRRYRNELYVGRELPGTLPAGRHVGSGEGCVDLGPGLGSLVLAPNAEVGLSDAVMQCGLELRFREGGEDFQPLGDTHTRQLKKLLQERGVVPWMRERLPLLFCDGRLVAVADLWIATDAASRPGTAVRWEDPPSIY